jgi:hypothetical protein
MKAAASLLQRDQLFLVARVTKEDSHRMHTLYVATPSTKLIE